MTAGPANSHFTVAIVSLSPSNFQGFTQPDTIVGVVSGPVQTVRVTGNGAIKCTGTYGTLIGYDSVGNVLGQQALSLIDPADCSPPENPDDVTFGAEATLTVSTGIIALFKIAPMEPLEFAVFNQTGHASATYTIVVAPGLAELGVNCESQNPIRTQTVTCTARMSDGREFIPKHLRSTTLDGSTVIVDRQLNNAPETSAYAWTGRAIVSTRVEIAVTVGGKDTTAVGSFAVLSRIGRLTNWMSEDFSDNGFPATPPNPTYVNFRPLSTRYPGFVPNDTGYSAPEGAVGLTVLLFPNEPSFGRFSNDNGPNKNVVFATSSPWGPNPDYNAGVGIYLTESLRSTDAFYLRQVGPPPNCTLSDMAQLHTGVLQHEQRHWNLARQGLSGMNFQAAVESLTVLPGQTSDAINQFWSGIRTAYADSVTASVNATHAVPDNYPVCIMRP